MGMVKFKKKHEKSNKNQEKLVMDTLKVHVTLPFFISGTP